MNKGGNIRVLLVDDEDRFRATTTASLRRRGFDVQAVASGAEAIERVKKGDVDTVVLDIKMPGMNGHDVLHEIKRLKPDVAVIMITGYSSEATAYEDLHEGAFAYLKKPCSIEFLDLKIREADFTRNERISANSRNGGRNETT